MSSQRRSRTAPAPAASTGQETSALPFLVFQPFGSFLHDQSRSAEDRVEEDWRQMLAPPVGLCVQGSLARPTGPLVEFNMYLALDSSTHQAVELGLLGSRDELCHHSALHKGCQSSELLLYHMIFIENCKKCEITLSNFVTLE